MFSVSHTYWVVARIPKIFHLSHFFFVFFTSKKGFRGINNVNEIMVDDSKD